MRAAPNGDAVVTGGLAFHGGTFLARIAKDGTQVFRKDFPEASGEVVTDAHVDGAGHVVAIVYVAVPGAPAPKLGEAAVSDLAVLTLDGATGAELARRGLRKSGTIGFVNARVSGSTASLLVRVRGAIDLGDGGVVDAQDDATYVVTLPLDGGAARARRVWLRGALTLARDDGAFVSLEQRGGRTLDDLAAGHATLVALVDEAGNKTHAGALDAMVTNEGGGARVNAIAFGADDALWLGGYVTVPGLVHEVDDHFLLARVAKSGATELLLQGGTPGGDQGVFALARTAAGYLAVGGAIKGQLALPTGTLASDRPAGFVAALDPNGAPCAGEIVGAQRVRHAIAVGGDEILVGGEGSIDGALDAAGPSGFVMRLSVGYGDE